MPHSVHLEGILKQPIKDKFKGEDLSLSLVLRNPNWQTSADSISNLTRDMVTTEPIGIQSWAAIHSYLILVYSTAKTKINVIFVAGIRLFDTRPITTKHRLRNLEFLSAHAVASTLNWNNAAVASY